MTRHHLHMSSYKFQKIVPATHEREFWEKQKFKNWLTENSRPKMKCKDQIKARREGNPSNTEPSEVLKSHATNLNGILSDTAQFGLN